MESSDKKDNTIKDETSKVVIELANKMENVLQNVDIDLKDTTVSQVTSVTTTVIANGLHNISESLGIKLITESSLTEEQKKLANLIYNTTKSTIQSFISDPNINNTIKITKILSQVIKQIEIIKVYGKSPSGSDKKAVAIQLGRILIKEITPDDKGEAEILMIYDLIAESTLEAMLEVSKVVNVAVVNEVTKKCCPGLLTIFKIMTTKK